MAPKNICKTNYKTLNSIICHGEAYQTWFMELRKSPTASFFVNYYEYEKLYLNSLIFVSSAIDEISDRTPYWLN